MEVETAALTNCTYSAWESSHTLSFTAALVIHIPYNTFPVSMHIPDLCFALYHLTMAVAVFIFHDKLSKHMLSELPVGNVYML